MSVRKKTYFYLLRTWKNMQKVLFKVRAQSCSKEGFAKKRKIYFFFYRDKQGEGFKPRSLTQENCNAPLIRSDSRRERVGIVRLVRPLRQAGADVAGDYPGLDHDLGHHVAADRGRFSQRKFGGRNAGRWNLCGAVAEWDESAGFCFDDDGCFFVFVFVGCLLGVNVGFKVEQSHKLLMVFSFFSFMSIFCFVDLTTIISFLG